MSHLERKAMQPSDVQNAIRELRREKKRIEERISGLKRIKAQRSATATVSKRSGERLSAHTRRRISEAAKKRWGALRAAKKEASPDWRENKALATLADVFSSL